MRRECYIRSNGEILRLPDRNKEARYTIKGDVLYLVRYSDVTPSGSRSQLTRPASVAVFFVYILGDRDPVCPLRSFVLHTPPGRKHRKEKNADTLSAPARKQDYLARIDIVKILNDKM